MTNKTDTIIVYKNNTPLDLLEKTLGPSPRVIKEGKAPWKEEEERARAIQLMLERDKESKH